MAYLNANIPVLYAQVRKEYLYDLQSHHGEVEDCVIFGLASMAGKPSYFTACSRMVQSIIDSLFQRSFKDHLIYHRFLGCDLMSWSCGIALVTILVLLFLTL